MKRNVWVYIVVSVLMFFVFSRVSFAAQGKAPKAVKIGLCFSITGKFAGFYHIMGDWEKNVVDVINEKGGIYVKEFKTRLPIQAIWYDDKSDPPTTMKFYERLVTVDKVDFLIGPTASPPAMSATPLADKYKIPMVLTSSNDPQIFARGLKYITSDLDSGVQWADAFYKILKAQTDAKTVALLTEDTVWPLGIYKGAVEFAKQGGFNVVFDKQAPADTKDFTPVITELKRLNPDVIDISAFAPFLTTFMKQALSQGLKPKLYHSCSGVSHGFLTAMGDAAKYMTGDHCWVPGMKHEGYEMMEEVVKRTKINILEYPYGPPCNFAAHQILIKAIETAGTLDREKVQEVLETASFGIIGGLWYRRPDGAGTFNYFPLQYVDGKTLPLYPPGVAKHKVIYPVPWK
jgi:branched-chain amino acid transport system substrate-binding protein